MIKEFLLGWLLKPQYLLTPLDSVVFVAEFFMVIFIISVVVATIQKIKEFLGKY